MTVAVQRGSKEIPACLRACRASALHIWQEVRLRKLGKQPSWRRIAGQFEMWIDPDDWMDRSFYLGTYAPLLTYFIRRWVKPGDTCLDVGAHKGYITLHMTWCVGRHGHVLAFEPDPRARHILQRNCERNGATQVHLLEHALGQRSGVTKFFLSSQLGWSSQFPNDMALETIAQEIEVPVRALDDLVAEQCIRLDARRFSFAKIDCEGAEPFVLQGMAKTLAAASPMLWVEINVGSLDSAGFSPQQVAWILQSLEYDVFAPKVQRSTLGRRQLMVKRLNVIDWAGPHRCFDVLALRPHEVSRLAEIGCAVVV